MRRLITAILLFISVGSFAQALSPVTKGLSTPTFVRPYSQPAPWQATGYMLNQSNAYAYLNVSPFIPSYKDTVTTSSTTADLYLMSAIEGSAATPVVKPGIATDTFVGLPLTSIGNLNITVQGTLMSSSGSPTVSYGTVTLEESTDNVNWGPYRAGSTIGSDTLNITGASLGFGGNLSYSWFLPLHPSLYYRVHIHFKSNSIQSTSWISQWYLKANYIEMTQH